MRFVLGMVFVHSVHWIYISSVLSLYSHRMGMEHSAGGSSFYDFFRFSCFPSFLFVSDSSNDPFSAVQTKTMKKLNFSHTNVSIFFALSSFRLDLPNARRLLNVRNSDFFCSPVTAPVNSKSKLTNVPYKYRKGTHRTECGMLNAKWWWKLSSAVCFRLAPVESDLCMFNIRIDYIRSRQHIFLVYARKYASSAAGRQRQRWNKFGGMWTGTIGSNKKNIYKTTTNTQCVFRSNHSSLLSPLTLPSVRLRFVQCPCSSVRYNWLCVATSRSRIFPQYHTRHTNDKRRKMKWSTLSSHTIQWNAATFYFDFITERGDWVSSSTIYDFLLFSSLLQ